MKYTIVNNLKVFENGQVFRIHNNFKRQGYKEIEVAYQKNQKGYWRFSINGKYVSLARFVWSAFNGEIPEKMEIDHIDTDKDNNNLSNLRLVTRTENVNNPLTIIHSSKPIKQFDKKGNFIKEFTGIKQAAKELNLSNTAIGNCLNGRSKTSGGFIWKYAQ